MNNNVTKKLFKILFIIYIIVLVLVIILKFPTGMADHAINEWISGGNHTRIKPQLIPFKTIKSYLYYLHSPTDWFAKNLLCNIIIFIPYGFLRPVFTRHRHKMFILTVVEGFLISVFFELFQYVSALGHMDVDDVILNTLGVVIGYGMYVLVLTVKRKYKIKSGKQVRRDIK